MLINRSALISAIALAGASPALADVTADAQLVLTITIEDVFIEDDVLGGFSAYGGDVTISDISLNGSTAGGGSPGNAPGAIGSNSESETAFFNGVDINDGDFFAGDNSIGPGSDAIVVTQNVSASASTIDSVFFSQVDSALTISFDNSSLSNPLEERFLFEFSIDAALTGNFDIGMPGNALALAEGEEIYALAESTLIGDPAEFILFGAENDDFYNFFELTSDSGVTPFSDNASLLVPVDFSNGDELITIEFRSSLLVNAVTAVPEPSTGLLFAGLGLASALRRRRL